MMAQHGANTCHKMMNHNLMDMNRHRRRNEALLGGSRRAAASHVETRGTPGTRGTRGSAAAAGVAPPDAARKCTAYQNALVVDSSPSRDGHVCIRRRWNHVLRCIGELRGRTASGQEEEKEDCARPDANHLHNFIEFHTISHHVQPRRCSALLRRPLTASQATPPWHRAKQHANLAVN